MAYQGETPWHQLGQRISEETARDLDLSMAAAGLDYSVSKSPMFLEDGRKVPNRQAIIRDDDHEVLGTASDSYTLIQNKAAFGVFGPAMAEHGLEVAAAGALGKGERAWMLFRLGVDIEPVPGDKVAGYGVALTGHDGSSSFQFRPTPIRVVCQNTLDAAVGGGTVKGRIFGIHHTSGSKSAVRQAKAIVSKVIEGMKETGETFTAMANRNMTPEETIEYINRVFPAADDSKISTQLKDRRRAVADLVWHGVGAELAGSTAEGTTAWAVYNAVGEYIDHVLPGQRASRTVTGGAAANVSALFGSGAAFKLDALKAARELVTV